MNKEKTTTKDKWDEWKSYGDWKLKNIGQLSRDYENAKIKFNSQVDGVSFEDYCAGRWQNNIL